MDKKIMMIHIPKTAGITIGHLLENTELFFGNKFGHHYASRIKTRLRIKRFNNFFKFAIVRNPWDKLWSGYKYMQKGSDFRKKKSKAVIGTNDFNQFVHKIYNERKYLEKVSRFSGDNLIYHQQLNWLLDKNENLLVDHVARFEDLNSLVVTLSEKFDLSELQEDFKETYLNKSIDRVPYQEIYTTETKEMVNEMYLRDIEYFKYTFE